MIKLDVQHYCHNCLYFRPDIDRPEIIAMTKGESPINIGEVDTIIRCKHRHRCTIIKHYIRDECEKEIHTKIENDKRAKRNGKN